MFGFLGPNGAGKSTTIRLLLGYLHPTAGRADVLGSTSSRSVAIRRRIGYLPGGIALYDTLTGRAAARLPRPAERARAGAPRANCASGSNCRAKTLSRLVRDYSRGMRQKIGIVQALQHDPELAILDEPTEGLDPLMQRAFYEILDDAQSGRADDLLFLARAVGSGARLRSRGDRPAGDAWWWLRRLRRCCARRKRNVEMRLAGAAAGRCTGVAGVSNVEVADGRRVTCRRRRRRRVRFSRRSSARVVDLTIEPPRLEEAFLEFYERADCVNAALFRHDVAAAARQARAGVARARRWGFLPPLIYARFGRSSRRCWRAEFARSSSPARRRRHLQPDRLGRARADPSDCHHPDVGVRGRLLGVGNRGRAPAGDARSRAGASDVRRALYFTLLAGVVAVCRRSTWRRCWRAAPRRRRSPAYRQSCRCGICRWCGSTACCCSARSRRSDWRRRHRSIALRRRSAGRWASRSPCTCSRCSARCGRTRNFCKPYSLFHYLKAKATLTGSSTPDDLLVLAAAIALAIAWSMVVFPRRDLAAPI